MKGAYLLLIYNPKRQKIKIGKLGIILFDKGYYVYVGSGMNSLEKRVNRHFSKSKKLRWHIDYFLMKSKPLKAILIPSRKKIEDDVASIVKRFSFYEIKNFGASDSKMNSHLFRIKNKQVFNQIKNEIEEIFEIKTLISKPL